MLEKSKHIVFLTPGFAQNEQDTSTIPAIQVYIRALKKQHPELNITIVAFQFPFVNNKFNWHDCEVIPINGRNKKIQKIQTWKNAYQTLQNLNKKKPISIIHSFWFGECAFIGHLFSKKNKIRHLCTLMGQEVSCKNLYLSLLPIKKMNLVFVSEFQKLQLVKTKNLQAKIIPWGIDHVDFSYPTIKTIDIIGVGSLIELKNYDLFIDIIFEINKKIPLKVILIGEGVQKEALQQKIKKMQLEQVITLMGLQSYGKTLEQISLAKILLHTSDYESFGMVFAEALQCKTTIVSKEMGCAFISENWHICTSKKDMVLTCIAALSSVLKETSFNNPFTINKTVKNYLTIYNE